VSTMMPVFRLAEDATSAWIYPSTTGFSPLLPSNCANKNLFAFDPRTDEGKRYLALLTAAHLSGRQVIVTWDDTVCYASTVGLYPKPTRIDITL